MIREEDYQTSTVDGARGFADMHAEPERCDYVPDEFEDESEDCDEEYEEENQNGLHNKYVISRTDGTPINPANVYFILKLEGEGDPIHMEACRKAVLKYADEIEIHIPQLAKDLREQYS